MTEAAPPTTTPLAGEPRALAVGTARAAAALGGAGVALVAAGTVRAGWGPDASAPLAAAALLGLSAGALHGAAALAPASLVASLAAVLVPACVGLCGPLAPALLSREVTLLLAMAIAAHAAGGLLARAVAGRRVTSIAAAASAGAALALFAVRLPALEGGAEVAADALLPLIGAALAALACLHVRSHGNPDSSASRPDRARGVVPPATSIRTSEDRPPGPSSAKQTSLAVTGALVACAALGLAVGAGRLTLAHELAEPGLLAACLAALGVVLGLALPAFVLGTDAAPGKRSLLAVLALAAPGPVATAFLLLGLALLVKAGPWTCAPTLVVACAGWTVAASAALVVAGAGLGGRARLATLAAGLALAALLAPQGARIAVRSLGGVDELSLALGVRDGDAGNDIRDALDSGQARLRFADDRDPAAHVVDLDPPTKAGSTAPPQTVRLLSVGGRIVAAAPARPGGRPGPAHALMATPLLEGLLPSLLAPEPPRRIAVLGLGVGLAVGAAARGPGLEALLVVEPTAGIAAAHRDPGDLFGPLTNHPLEDPRVTLTVEPRWPWLRGQGAGVWDALVAGAVGPSPRAARLLRGATGGVVVARIDPAGARVAGKEARWSIRAPLAAFLEAFPDATAWWPQADGGLILVGGAGRLAPERVAARWQASPQAREALRPVGVLGSIDVLGLVIAGPEGIAALLADTGLGDDPLALSAVAASSLPRAFEGGEVAPIASRARALADLAEEAGTRAAPAAVPLALASIAAARTSKGLRVLGDLLLRAGREQEAVLAWGEASELDPTDMAPRVSMALLHQRHGRSADARRLLESAMSGDAARDAHLHYLLGSIALQAEELNDARRHFVAAGDFADARARASLAREMLRREVGAELHGLSTPQRLEAARQSLAAAVSARARARRARDQPDGGPEGQAAHQEAERKHADAVAALLPLAGAPQDDATRREVGRLLRRAADDEPLEVARQHLARLAAEALAPDAPDPRGPDVALQDGVDPALAIERAAALRLAGDVESSESLLRALVLGPGARLPRAWVALAELHDARGRPDAAIEAYERSLAVGTSSSLDVRVLKAIAALHVHAGRRDRAAQALEEALRVAPDHPQVLLDLGALQVDLGRGGDALRTYRRFIEVAPEHPARGRVEEAIRKLGG